MTLQVDQNLLHYRLMEQIGEGGMGVVWKAEDTKLGRLVAVKVLPAEVSEEPDRLARFDREARTLAALHHPNVATIFGFEEADGVRFLVMELVEGADLSERLQRGAVPAEEALDIARQMAEGIEAAHEQGIVHRDLKPANVKLGPDGKVKVLDFGLAKAWRGESAGAISGSGALSQSPTLAHTGTAAGIILGTAAYMSPEQARGKPVDKRSDIWAFGVVLFEILTGNRMFAGETVSDILAGVLKTEIDFEALPSDTPAGIRRLLRRCLQRDPRQRLRDIGDARIEIDTLTNETTQEVTGDSVGSRRRGVSLPAFATALVIAAGFAIATLLLTWWAPASSVAQPAPVTEFSLWVDDLGSFALSPDGQQIAYVDGSSLLLRDLADRTPRVLMEDEDIERTPIAWSPDGRELALAIGERIWRVPTDGGERRPVCQLPRPADFPRAGILSAAWLENDSILIAAWRGGIYKVAATGGEPQLLIPIDPETEVDFHSIQVLPDGKSLVLSLHPQNDGSSPYRPVILLYRDDSKTEIVIPPKLGEMRLWAYSQGMLFMTQVHSIESSLWAIPFDAGQGRIVGEATMLIPRAGPATVGTGGTLLYLTDKEQPGIVVRLDHNGSELGRLGNSGPAIADPALSPDGSRLAYVINDSELWVHDLQRDTTTRLVRDAIFIEAPQWSLDGRMVYYQDNEVGRFLRIRAEPGAEAETVFEDTDGASLAADGSGMLARVGDFRLTGEQGFYWIPFDENGHPGERGKLLNTVSRGGRLSPDNRMLAYASIDTGQYETFLTSFPEADQTIQISSGNGGMPQWSADGQSVFYLAGGAMVEVEVGFDPDGRLTASPARELFKLDGAVLMSRQGWSVDPDGGGFLFVKSLETDTREEIVVRRNGLNGTTSTP